MRNETVNTENKIHCYNEIRKLYASCVTHKLGFGNFPCHRSPTQKHKTRDVSNDGSGSSLALYLGKYSIVITLAIEFTYKHGSVLLVTGHLSKAQEF
jgi:hypothetical protein